MSYHYHHCTLKFVIVLETSYREQDIRVHQENLGEDKKRERDVLVVLGEIALVLYEGFLL